MWVGIGGRADGFSLLYFWGGTDLRSGDECCLLRLRFRELL